MMNFRVSEFESEIEAIVGALEPIEESDATAVLATWKRTSHDTGKAQSRVKDTRKSTLKRRVSHQERTKTRSCGVGWSYAKLPKKGASKLLEQMLACGPCQASRS